MTEVTSFRYPLMPLLYHRGINGLTLCFPLSIEITAWQYLPQDLPTQFYLPLRNSQQQNRREYVTEFDQYKLLFMELKLSDNLEERSVCILSLKSNYPT